MSDGAAKRSTWVWVLTLFVILFVVGGGTFGCQGPKSQPYSGTDADGAVGQGDGGGSPGKVVLPGGFEPSIACGGLGKHCGVNEPCQAKLACAGSNCMPAVDGKTVLSCGDASCPGDAPICTLGICLSVDQLACVCARPEAQAIYNSCKSLLTSGGPKCLDEDVLCDASPDDCCDGLSCLRGDDDNGKRALGLCKKACSGEADCAASECCASADGIAGTFCGPLALCQRACGDLRAECDGKLKPCCDGMICASSPNDAALDGCQMACQKDTDCDSGCCILFTGKDNGVCAPKDRCAAL